MGKKQEELSDVFWDNLRDLKRDVGFQSRFSLMSDNYMPLVERVVKLEETLDTLLNHLELIVDYRAIKTSIRKSNVRKEIK